MVKYVVTTTTNIKYVAPDQWSAKEKAEAWFKYAAELNISPFWVFVTEEDEGTITRKHTFER